MKNPFEAPDFSQPFETATESTAQENLTQKEVLESEIHTEANDNFKKTQQAVLARFGVGEYADLLSGRV